MHLIALEAYGFKSFADKIRLSFDNGMTAIVGPNGSGKSNITDAIRWVLGEGKKGLLRLSKSEDIIFAGTPKRHALGIAEVSLTFLNEGELNLDFREIVVTRRLYRSGESEFFINRSSCRLKDIYALFADTGIGADSMSIIGQNRIDDILSGKPEDTRAYFEEAAGITKYRTRKYESLRKLDDMEKNLARVKDIMSEIENTLGPLLEAAQKKQKFDELSKELFKYRLTEVYNKYSEANSNKQSLEKECSEIKNFIISAESKILESENNRARISKTITDEEQKFDEFTKKLEAVRDEIAVIEKEIVKLSERANNKEAALKRIVDTREGYNQDKNRLENELNSLQNDEKAKEQELEKASAEIKEQEAKYKDKITEKQESEKFQNVLDNFKVEEDKIRARGDEISKNISITNDRVGLLERLKEDYEGFNKAAKAVLKASESFRKGVHGAVIELIGVEDKYKVAVEVALGAAAQNIVVEDERTAKAAIEYLKRGNYGRATFLPLSTITVKESYGEVRDPACLGTLDKFVTTDEKYKKLVKFLLSRTLLVDNLDSALILARKENFSKRIVTIDGSLLMPGGSITGGSTKSRHASFFGRTREIEDLKSKVKTLEREQQENTKLFAEKKADREEAERNFRKTQAELDSTLNQIKDDIQEKKTALLLLQQAKEHIGENIQKTSDELNKVVQNIEKTLNEEETLNSDEEIRESLSNQTSLRDAKLSEKLSIESERDACGALRLEHSAEIKREEKIIREMNAKRTQLQEDKHKKELAIERADAIMEEAQNELVKNFELDVSAAEKEVVDSPKGEVAKKIETLTGEIDSLGDINHAALTEYEESKNRYTFFETQSGDLVKAKEDLILLINDIDAEMSQRFTQAFNEIGGYFDEIFKRLFGGGMGELKLTDPQDVLNTGVTIIAELPNKKRQNLFALSGGERALTVIALLFALLKYKPSPFCVLDEIDAPLDEANLVRFGAFLKEYGKDTQFIVVTHRKTTMEVANVMYGVTASEGVSQVLSVKIDDALADN